MPTITRVITGDVDDLASVTLLTLVRTDTGADVAFGGGGAFTEGAGGVWSIAFTAPAAGLTYAYTYRRTFDDDTYLDGAGTLVDTGAAYAGRYTSTTRLDVRLNALNLTQYLDLNADGVRDPGAAPQVIDNAEGRVDLYTGGPYVFTGGTARDQAAARSTFARWADELAVDEAVGKRVPVTSDAGQALERRVALVIREMELFREGRLKPYASNTVKLPGAVSDNAQPSVPAVLAGQAGLAPSAGPRSQVTGAADAGLLAAQRRAAPSCGW